MEFFLCLRETESDTFSPNKEMKSYTHQLGREGGLSQGSPRSPTQGG
jgi:hypothetical protein